MNTVYEIGPFRLDTVAGVLTHEGRPMALGARGVAVLTTLVQVPNEYVRKASILDAAWPGLVVEENNLAAQISAIRRTLARVPGGENWIETLARRGYRFVGPVAEIAGRPGPPVAADRKRTNLPELLTSFVGRERELAEIKQLLPSTRLLTLTGTGGMARSTPRSTAGMRRSRRWSPKSPQGFLGASIPLAKPAGSPNATETTSARCS